MLIRLAQPEDLPALRDIYNDEVINGTATLDLRPKSLWERESWFYAHNRDNHPLLAAEEDGAVIGYACLSPYREKEAYASTVELSVYVARSHRGRGVASALLAELLALAREDRRTHLVVSVITGGNAASRRLHEKFGFLSAGVIHQAAFKHGRWRDIENYELTV